jgi:AGZA family xanthine/uracil permease-like MFS transporter
MTSYRWAQPGDLNAFFGLMLDNLTVLLILFTSLSSNLPPEEQLPGQYRFTPEFVLTRMIPGTALGVLVGDLIYTWLAFRLARRCGRTDVTAMPLGLDTPSTFGVAFFILLPVLQEARQAGLEASAAMQLAWRVGMGVLVLVGLFKMGCAPLGNAVRRWIPQAGLLGSLAAVALALIAFLPLLFEGIAAQPLVGLPALLFLLVVLVGRRTLPGRIPGVLAAAGLSSVLYWVAAALGPLLGIVLVPPPEVVPQATGHLPPLGAALLDFTTDWSQVWSLALAKLPIALPFALATLVGGIDCTESAAAAGDEYDTRAILLTEGLASLVAGALGGVIQTTPYIGQPAYKAMGGRAAYTLATALFVGAAGCFGWFDLLFRWLPPAALYPILVYVGLEIVAQAFRVVPTRHYPALALAALPALAALAGVVWGNLAGPLRPQSPREEIILLTLRCLQNGFLVTSLLWGATLAQILDGRLVPAACYLLLAAAFALVGVIHSPLPEAPLALPGAVYQELTARQPPPQGAIAENRPAAPLTMRYQVQSPFHWAGAYLLAAGLLLVLARWSRPEEPPFSDQQPDHQTRRLPEEPPAQPGRQQQPASEQ